MATSGVGFRWLDLLEKEFDKACVELDTSLSELESEEPDVVFSSRQKIATLSSCFAQLTHKALTIFQNSAKLDAELVDIRAELIQLRAAGQKCGDITVNVPQSARARAEAAQLARENAALRETVLALHSELFGARLATKYLDKELAGRIQQLQLLGSDMRAELRDSLWAQVEAEILLQRHKTLVRVCRGLAPRAPRPPASHAPPAPRTVRVRRSPHLGLGISVTGGREHGVPILISELEAGGPAALTGELYVGDAILAINDLDLTQACHKEAVQALQSVKGDCALCVQFIATDDDDRLSEDNYRFPLYPEDGEGFEEPDASGATPTAPRTPEYNHNDNSASECDEDNSYAREPVYDPHRVCLHDGVRDSVPLYEPERRTYDRNENGPKRSVFVSNKYGTRDENGPYDKAYEPRDVNGPYDKAHEPRDVNGPYEKSYESREVNGPYDNSYELKNENGPYDKYGQRNENGPYDKSHELKSKDENGPYVQERAVDSVTHYADYNNINNLSILDMDDDSIKIEARLEMSGAVSGSTSVRSTPVHTRNSLKKKRKPQDWRTKGAYCAVSDAQSSDDLPTNDTKETSPSGYLPISIPSLAHETSCALTAPVTAAVTSTVTSNVTSTVTSSVPADKPPSVTSNVTSAVMSTIMVTSSASVLPKSKGNGDSRSRKDTKGFRIGSARRVTEPLRNGETDRERRPPPRLLPGRGDPDFGTPV